MKKEGTIGIHTENILPIIKKWLYSEHDIFLRELVSNAHDAITKLKYLSSIGEYQNIHHSYQIDILINKEEKTLTIRDNGIGLTQEEVEKYISQVAFSGAQEFVNKYEKNQESKDIIGFFGLGFYSAFMVSTLVEIRSLSYQKDAQAVYWKSEGNHTYEIDSCDKTDIGTEIILHLDKESEDFLNPSTVKTTLEKYSSFLPTPITIDNEPLKQNTAIWRKSPADITEEEYKNLYTSLFPNRIAEPVLHFHIKTDFPFEVNGIFYFPKSSKGMEPQEGNVKLFVKDVFVGEGLKEIVPEFLSPLVGVIESNDIPLNVSRSQLQGDPRIHKLATHIENKFTDRVIQIFKEDRNNMRDLWSDIAPFIKFGVMRSDHFYNKIKEYLLFENDKNEWLTLPELLENKNLPKKENKTIIFYTDRSQGFSSYTQALQSKGIPYIIMESPFDGHFYSFLEQKDQNLQFARVDSELNETLFSNDDLSTEDKEVMAKAFKDLLGDDKAEVQVKPLDNIEIPAVIVANEQMRRWSEMSSMMGQDMAQMYQGLLGKTILLNSTNTITKMVFDLEKEGKKQDAQLLAEQIVDLALLDTGSLTPVRQKEFISRSLAYLKK